MQPEKVLGLLAWHVPVIANWTQACAWNRQISMEPGASRAAFRDTSQLWPEDDSNLKDSANRQWEKLMEQIGLRCKDRDSTHLGFNSCLLLGFFGQAGLALHFLTEYQVELTSAPKIELNLTCHPDKSISVKSLQRSTEVYYIIPA